MYPPMRERYICLFTETKFLGEASGSKQFRSKSKQKKLTQKPDLQPQC